MAFGGGGAIGEVFVTVRPETGRFAPDARRGILGGLKGVGTAVGSNFSKEFKGAAKFVSGAAIIGLLKGSVDAASDLNETVSKTGVVFGKAAPAVTAFGKTAARSVGLSEQAAGEAAATFGNLFVSMKIGQKPAADMSVSLVKLAGDLASFNNASPEDALEALRSGLVGETEPLRRFGINLNDAALREEALRLGLVKSTKEVLPAAAKAQASYSLILKQSKTAQGDFARTSGGLANQQRIVAAEFKNTQAQLGKQLLPTMLSAAKASNRLLGGFNRLDKATGGFASKALLGGVAAAGAAIGIAKVVRAVRDLRGAWVAFRTARAAGALVDTAVAAGQAATATKVAGDAAAVAGGKFAAMGKLGVLGFGAVGLAIGSVIKTGHDYVQGLKDQNKIVDPAGSLIQSLANKVGELAGRNKTNAETAKQAASATGQNAAELKTLGGVAGGVSPKLATLTGKLKDLKQGFRDQVAPVRESIEAYKGLTTQSDVTAGQVVKDLHNQVANFKTYSKDVKRLIKEGVSPAAIQELSKKGPEFVHGLVTGTSRQLEDYKRTWKEKQAAVRGSFAESMELQFTNLAKKIKAMQKEIDKLKGKTVDVKANAQVEINASTRRGLLALGIKGYGTRFFARGGKITEGTTPTADDVLIRASKHETVVSAKDSRDPWFQGWASAKRIPGYATGGIIGGFGNPAIRTTRRYGELAAAELGGRAGKELAKAVAEAARFTGAARTGGGLVGPVGRSAQAILDFIRVADRLPYRLGAAGPSAYDCSGLVGEIWNRVTGNKSFVRRWTTNDKPWSTMGFIPISRNAGRFYEGNQSKPLKGRPHHSFMIGFRNGRPFGHTAGQFMGLAFEAANSRAGIRIGGNASQIYSFPLLGYLPLADRKYRSKAFDQGGLLPNEPFIGIGTRTGQLISLNERGRETVIPAGGSGAGVTQNFTLVQQPGQSGPAFVQAAMFAARTQLRPAG